MKVIISGGGTGGHIYPGISIADTLMEKDIKTEILFIGTASGLESTLVPRKGYRFEAIRVKGFRRRVSIDTFKTLILLLKGMRDAGKILKDFDPDIVIGTGGYVAGPVLFLAALKGIPTLIHEQNVLPGVTNRILGRFVDRVAVSFEEAVKYFNNKNKVVVTGNPIRKEILEKTKDVSIRALGLKPELPLVLVFGGSKGSGKLNNAVLEVIYRLAERPEFQLLQVTGNDHYDKFTDMLKKRGISHEKLEHIKIVPYLHQMPDALTAADLVITSAGAITLAEITAVGIPAILIPKSHATDNHQEYNARALERKGAAVVILERELNGKKLYLQVSELVRDKKVLHHMRKASKQMGKIEAADRIYEVIRELLKL